MGIMTNHFVDSAAADVDADSEAPNLLLLLSHAASFRRRRTNAGASNGAGRLFECKTCSRTFPTFQALGGHRTGHKRQHDDGDDAHDAPAPKKAAAHQCPVCGLVFPMGQALGGHMRRHKDVLANGNKNNVFMIKSHKQEEEEEDAHSPCSDSSSGKSEPLSGCTSDARHEDDSNSPPMDAFRFVDLELRLGMAPPTVVATATPAAKAAYDDRFLTALRLGIES